MNSLRGRQDRKPSKGRQVACVACGRVLGARRDGHPRMHKPHNRLQNRFQSGSDWCDGSEYPGEDP